jgi:hypothetical protein
MAVNLSGFLLHNQFPGNLFATGLDGDKINPGFQIGNIQYLTSSPALLL